MVWYRNLISNRMQKRGYSEYFAYQIFQKRWNDIVTANSKSLLQKMWAHRRGFYSNRIDLYNLTEDNYKFFLSDFTYYKLHPINNIFSRWIDDKLTMRLILEPFSEYLPEYFYHLVDGEVIRLLDCPESSGNSMEDIITLLMNYKALAVKPLAGTSGEGFVKLSHGSEGFKYNQNPTTVKVLLEKFSEWKRQNGLGTLITEFIQPHHQLAKIWPESTNSIRLSVIRRKHRKAEIINAMIRFGASVGGLIDNIGPGGFSIIDLESGRFFDSKIVKNDKLFKCTFHPDTNEPLSGIIPHWDLVKEKILQISNYIPQIISMGLDIAITETGFKILEINSHEGNTINQSYHPYLLDDPTKSFYNALILEKMQQLGQIREQSLIRKLQRKILKFFKQL